MRQPISETESLLKQALARAGGWTDLRFHSRRTRTFGIKKGEVTEMSSRVHGGIGIRVLRDGVWGFASTSELTQRGLETALKQAETLAKEMTSRKRKRTRLNAAKNLARGVFAVPGYEELDSMTSEEKIKRVRDAEVSLRSACGSINSASATYNEVFEDKIVLTSDGADAVIRLARPELRLEAYASDGTRVAHGRENVGGTGAWECLFNAGRGIDELIESAARSADTLLRAETGEGGLKTVILAPAMVGLLSHEAIGHTVEADFVNAGSVAKGKLGQMIASPLVTLCDSGASEIRDGAGGMIPVDDEGILAGKTTIIAKGALASYLHSRESASEHGVEPTGNARAWEFDDEPLIRMRNTYIEPGDSDLEEMIAAVDDGYFVDGPAGGQADATAEFMFGATKVRRIRGGKLADPVQRLTLSGNAFEVLRSVDAVSRDFRWDLGAGHCGKGQPAKVDAGGPYLRCRILVGGKQ